MLLEVERQTTYVGLHIIIGKALYTRIRYFNYDHPCLYVQEGPTAQREISIIWVTGDDNRRLHYPESNGF